MHRFRVIPFYEIRLPTAASEELLQLFALDARQHSGIADLVAVEVQDGEHGAIGDGVEELVGLPRRRQRPGLRFPVADYTGDDQSRIVEGGAEGVADRIPQFPAFVNRPRKDCSRSHMAGNSARE